mgnify:FL=1
MAVSEVGVWSTPDEETRLAEKAEAAANPPAPQPASAPLPPVPTEADKFNAYIESLGLLDSLAK